MKRPKKLFIIYFLINNIYGEKKLFNYKLDESIYLQYSQVYRFLICAFKWCPEKIKYFYSNALKFKYFRRLGVLYAYVFWIMSRSQAIFFVSCRRIKSFIATFRRWRNIIVLNKVNAVNNPKTKKKTDSTQDTE